MDSGHIEPELRYIEPIVRDGKFQNALVRVFVILQIRMLDRRAAAHRVLSWREQVGLGIFVLRC
jgi:hypothetical protein